jgi:integrase
MKDKAGSAAGVTRIRLQKGRHLVKRGDVWYLESCAEGRQLRRSLGTGDVQEATRKAAAGEEAPQATFRPPGGAAAPLTLEKAYAEFEEWFRKSHKPSGSRVTLPTVEAFVDFVGAGSDTRAVTKAHVQNFVDQKAERSAIYVRNEFARVRAFLRRIETKHKDAVDLDCVRGIDLPKDEGTTRTVPDPETVRAILRKLGSHPWLGDFVTVLLETGMRPGELLAVRGVDLRGKLLDIKPWGSWSPKSKWSVRTLQLTEPAARILEERKKRLFEKGWPVFSLPNGKVRNVKYTSAQYREALKEDGQIPAAFQDANLYCWRHVFCSFHAQPGPAFMELQTLAAYIGHAPGSTRTLERWYTDREAMRRGAPPSLVGEPKEGKVATLASGKAHGKAE